MSRHAAPVAVAPEPHPATAAPSRHDPVVTSLSEVAGGPAGRRRLAAPPSLGASFLWGAGPVLVLLAMANLIITQLVNQPCRSRNWQSPIQFVHLCYSDIPAAVGGTHAPQSAGNWLLTSLAGWLAPQGQNHLRTAVDLVTIIIAVALVLLVLAVVRLAGHRPWDAALVALSPVIITAGLVSTDIVALAAAFGGLSLMVPALTQLRSAAWRPALAGLLIGVAGSVRPAALLLLVALVVTLLRSRTQAEARPMETLAPLGLAGAAGLAVPNLIQFLHSPKDWWAYPKGLLNPDLGYGSLLVIPRLLARGIPADQRNLSAPIWTAFVGLAVMAVILLARAAMPQALRNEWMPLHDRGLQVACALVVLAPMVIALAGPAVLRSLTSSPPGAGAGKVFWLVGSVAVLGWIAYLVTTARRPPRMPVVALLLTAGLMLVTPAIPVQAGLWLVPLLALALPSWRLVLAWSAAEVLYAGATWLFIFGLSEPNRGLPVGWYTVFALARIGAWAAVMVQAARVVRHPEVDPVDFPKRDRTQ